jgi:hypothetical protein
VRRVAGPKRPCRRRLLVGGFPVAGQQSTQRYCLEKLLQQLLRLFAQCVDLFVPVTKPREREADQVLVCPSLELIDAPTGLFVVLGYQNVALLVIVLLEQLHLIQHPQSEQERCNCCPVLESVVGQLVEIVLGLIAKLAELLDEGGPNSGREPPRRARHRPVAGQQDAERHCCEELLKGIH